MAQVLTEVCDNGSIFDLYSKQNMTFKRSTAWRLARECAGQPFSFSLQINQSMHRLLESSVSLHSHHKSDLGLDKTFVGGGIWKRGLVVGGGILKRGLDRWGVRGRHTEFTRTYCVRKSKEFFSPHLEFSRFRSGWKSDCLCFVFSPLPDLHAAGIGHIHSMGYMHRCIVHQHKQAQSSAYTARQICMLI
jgi:hypothetical protein